VEEKIDYKSNHVAVIGTDPTLVFDTASNLLEKRRSKW